MRILIAAHKNPYDPNPRGGETSVRILADYLKERGHTLAIWCYGGSPTELQSLANDCEIILTWGKAAPQVLALGKPYILMVRFWRNVQPLPVGDLLNDAIDENFQRENQPLFSNAKAVITNNHYSAKVLKRIYGVDAVVSYVPVIKPEGVSSGGDYLTIITPEIYGEYELVKKIWSYQPDWKFLIINPLDNSFDDLINCMVYPYMPINEVLSQTQILLTPTYHHDICGTRRTPIAIFFSVLLCLHGNFSLQCYGTSLPDLKELR